MSPKRTETYETKKKKPPNIKYEILSRSMDFEIFAFLSFDRQQSLYICVCVRARARVCVCVRIT